MKYALSLILSFTMYNQSITRLNGTFKSEICSVFALKMKYTAS